MDLNTKNEARRGRAADSSAPDVPLEGLRSAPLATDALEFLEGQHLAVGRRFQDLDGLASPKEKDAAFGRVADALAIHTAIEEQYFYPAIHDPRTKNLLIDSLHEHLEMKRALVDLVQLPVEDEAFDEKVATLRQLVSRHIQADEAELFPLVRRTVAREDLLVAAESMQAEAARMEGTDPRFRVFPETMQPAR